MRIRIIGPADDPVFRDVCDTFTRAIHELQLDAAIDEVTRLEDIQAYPVAVYPAVLIEDRLVSEGHPITFDQAKKYLTKNQ